MSMSYTAMVQTFTAQRNPLCRPFEVDRLIHRCFRSDILPERADHPSFQDSEIFGGLYLTRRAWKDRIEEPKNEHPHETILDALFWDDSFPRRPLCILGMVGAGKSTLIDYYLRCYCPTKGNRQGRLRQEADPPLRCPDDPRQHRLLPSILPVPAIRDADQVPGAGLRPR